MTDTEQIYLCAVRYGLGRKTYITGVISDFMCSQKLSADCKDIMLRDISEAREDNRLGDECDKQEWEKLFNYLKKTHD